MLSPYISWHHKLGWKDLCAKCGPKLLPYFETVNGYPTSCSFGGFANELSGGTTGEIQGQMENAPRTF
jgi:hypothetical protein